MRFAVMALVRICLLPIFPIVVFIRAIEWETTEGYFEGPRTVWQHTKEEWESWWRFLQ